MLAGCENTTVSATGHATPIIAKMSSNSHFDREIRKTLEQGVSKGERKLQIATIEAAFRCRTNPVRAHQLATLCYTKTVDTPFMPFDLAEIALAETGGNRLSAKAISNKGALGVWQLMPQRAKSHGYSPHDMGNDEKCAEAAVRELFTKLEAASGKLERAKKLYCGQGPEADAYMLKIHRIRRELYAIQESQTRRVAMEDTSFRTR